MKDVTLNSGEVMTDAEFIKERGFGDIPTEFVATKDDLVSLANRLVQEMLGDDFNLALCSGRTPHLRYRYLVFRFERVMAFLPEHEDEMREKMRLGREKNEEAVKKVVAEWEAAGFGKGENSYV